MSILRIKMPYHRNLREIDMESVRIVSSKDITEVRFHYAEFLDGLPLNDDELLELDEVGRFILVDYWSDINKVDEAEDLPLDKDGEV